MTINDSFWTNYQFSENDLDSLYNHLLETQIPLNKTELSIFLISKIIEKQKEVITKERQSGATTYLPKEQYKVGQSLVFPSRNWHKGTVVDVRKGNNPDYTDIEVITVEFSPDDKVSFASNLSDHVLNNPIETEDNEFLVLNNVFEKFREPLVKKLEAILLKNDDLVCIAGSYFPRALLVDVSVGHLNLCEAVLEMIDGGPMNSHELIAQIELPTDVNANLTEFSLNLALQEDSRFDEVGPAGETQWFLNRLEPDEVQETPATLRNQVEPVDLPDDLEQYRNLGSELCDELEPDCDCDEVDEVTISLTYPHWRAGTLPLTAKLKRLFPTAYETPRIKFDFVDGHNQSTFGGWVVRPSKYIFGLKDWYRKEGFIPGSLVHVSRGTKPGQVVIRADKQRNSKEWIRTVLVGADGGIVFALLKQVVTCIFDERMALVIPDVAAVDKLWDTKSRQPIEKTIQNIMHELSKLNPQGHIHAQEIYAAVNLIRRCPPSVVINVLFNQPWATHLGDLYFRIVEN
ncbi:MAG: hypothetical protein C0410_04080 [Anaerolinea sp.]|nr:hypothetical protein [Anaerolinea sp.]